MGERAFLQPVDIGDLPEYPLDRDARLDSHGFMPWEFRRWMSSDMRWSGTHECKSIWFELVNASHSETPVGTLPHDMRRLARMVQPPVDAGHFEALCALPFGPLHGWVPCRVEDEVRLMHDTVLRIVLSAFASRATHRARVEAASDARRLARLTEDIAQLAPALAADARKVRFVDVFIKDAIAQRGGERRTAADLHNGIQACLAAQQEGRFPDKR